LQLTPNAPRLRAKKDKTLAPHGVYDFTRVLENVLYFLELKWIF
jgi:hypothetical protein